VTFGSPPGAHGSVTLAMGREASSTVTHDAAQVDGWAASSRGRAGDERLPRLRLLYHGDLSRLGWLTAPDAVPRGGGFLTVGRNDPPFAGPGAAPPRPLDDPQVSREQLRVRWLGAIGRFEVEPTRSARRPVGRVELREGSLEAPTTSPLLGPTLLAPGACIAIGDRVLLGLELGRAPPRDADRMGLVGESEALWALRDEVRSVARFGRPSLVIGPTGAGKELVARALHLAGPRAPNPFVPVNCAALPETLVESVLFGHKKGAFTGADAEEKGLFRAADGGTLFLDELGELPLSVQPKLLRVLQDGVVVPVGAHEGRRVDVRLVAATHRDLDARVRAGTLREDLYHRMAAHVLRVPSLAERRFDIPELFAHMLGRLRAEHVALEWMWEAGRAWRPVLPIGFLADLLRRPYPGNVRELENLVERTARLNLHPGVFRAPDAPSAAAMRLAEAPIPAGESSDRLSDPPVAEALLRASGEALGIAHKTVLKLLPPEVLAALEAQTAREGLGDEARAQLLRARAGEALFALFEAHAFNQSGVASALGTSRTTVIKLMEDLGMPRAADLDAAAIGRARAEAGGDLDAAARLLRVSPSALKKRLTLLNLKTRG
jgi:transcriptional regulator with GAF, ATPase, and Fis domain